MTHYEPTKAFSGYYVFDGNRALGTVRKTELWVVRGTRIVWDAYKAGKYIAGGFATRKEATEALKGLAKVQGA